jgi:hypothetical protein
MGKMPFVPDKKNHYEGKTPFVPDKKQPTKNVTGYISSKYTKKDRIYKILNYL